MKVADEGNSWG